MLSGLLWNLFPWVKGLQKHLKALDTFQRLSPAEARRELGRRLLAQMRYFGTRADALPEWRQAAKARSVDDLWRLWPQMPVLSKRDLQNRFHPREMQTRLKLRGVASATGGSTGEPTPYFHDGEMLRAAVATRFYTWLKFGWRPGMPKICVWGSERDIGKQPSLHRRLIARLRRDYLVDGYGLNARTVDRVLSVLRRHRKVAMFGFTSMLEFLAREVLQRGDLPPAGKVQAAWNGGEMLSDSQVELFENAFGTPLLNCYGGRELSAMAYQPRRGAALQVLRPLLFVEILDEQAAPVEPGQSGRLVWSSTVCRGTPFLRYDVGDAGCCEARDQDESGIRALKELHGRTAGLWKLPSGQTVNCLFWNHLFKEFPEVQQFQVVIRNNSRLQLNFRGPGFRAKRERQLRQILLEFLGDLPVGIAWVDRMPLTGQGKLVQVLRQP